jgi:hypothetical protein
MWRHGDVLIAAIETIPTAAKRRLQAILVEGEITGHSHRFEDASAVEVWQFNDQLFVKVVDNFARLIHEEHKPIQLPKGFYKVWVQREYTPGEIRRVVD